MRYFSRGKAVQESNAITIQMFFSVVRLHRRHQRLKLSKQCFERLYLRGKAILAAPRPD